MSLNENKINELLQTPQQKKENQNCTSEYAQSEDSDTNLKEILLILKSLFLLKTFRKIPKQKNKIDIINCQLSSNPNIIDEDKIEKISYDEKDIAKNRTNSKKLPSVKSLDSIDKDGFIITDNDKKAIEKNRSFPNKAQSISNSTGSIWDSNSDKDYDPSNDETIDSVSDDSSKDFARIELELSSEDGNQDVENGTLDTGETLRGCKTNKNDED